MAPLGLWLRETVAPLPAKTKTFHCPQLVKLSDYAVLIPCPLDVDSRPTFRLVYQVLDFDY